MTVGLTLTIFVWRKSIPLSKELLQHEAEDAEELLMPGADPSVITRDYGTV